MAIATSKHAAIKLACHPEGQCPAGRPTHCNYPELVEGSEGGFTNIVDYKIQPQ